MAETEALQSSNILLTPNSCANCLDTQTVGQNQSVNGNFSNYLHGHLNKV